MLESKDSVLMLVRLEEELWNKIVQIGGFLKIFLFKVLFFFWGVGGGVFITIKNKLLTWQFSFLIANMHMPYQFAQDL